MVVAREEGAEKGEEVVTAMGRGAVLEAVVVVAVVKLKKVSEEGDRRDWPFLSARRRRRA